MEEDIGRITHYFPRIGVAVVHVEHGVLRIGDAVRIRGRETDFTQEVQSLQMEHTSVEEVSEGASAGMKTDQAVRENDRILKVTGD